MSRKQSWRQHQRGTSMVEVLVAVLVLSFGLVGISALQVRAIMNSSSAVVRGNVVQQSIALGESMRANSFNARSGCTGTSAEVNLLNNDVNDYFNSNPMADRATNLRVPVIPLNCTVSTDYNFFKRWDDGRAVGGSADAAIGLYYRF